MNGDIAVSKKKAAYLMLDEGLDIEVVKRGLDTIKEVASGLMLAKDVFEFIRKETS
jgi:hypothetical protein